MTLVRMDKERIQNHLRYDWWQYAVAIAAILIIWNLYFTMTAPRTPNHKKVDIYLIGNYVDESLRNELGQEVRNSFPQQKEINFYSIPLTSREDTAGWQKFMLYLAAHEGDIYVVDKRIFKDLALMDDFLPLDDYIDKDELARQWTERLQEVTLTIEGHDSSHVYGVPADGCLALEKLGYDTQDKIMVIPVFTQNKENAVGVFQWINVHGK